jgi:predicted enzyme related to lactoylglutathione lyase
MLSLIQNLKSRIQNGIMAFQYTDAFVTLGAADAEALVQFYRQLLDREPNPYIRNVYAEFQVSGLRLGIFQPKPNHLQEFEQSAPSGMSLCLEVDDLEVAIIHLSSMGYPPPGEITTASHGREIYAYDPAGNRLILHQSTDKTE